MALKTLKETRERICREHMNAENAHEFARCIQAFKHPRYELMATGEIYDGDAEVDKLLQENKHAFPDFHFDPEQLHHADSGIFVEGAFRGSHLGNWRGLPATGRKVDVPMVIFFRFEGTEMICERSFFDLNTALQQLGVAWNPNSVAGKISTVVNHPMTIGRALLRQLRTKRR